MKAVWRAKHSKEGIPFQVPAGAEVEVLKFYPKRRVLVEYQGQPILTLQACIRRLSSQEHAEEK